jgi:hypothetical protein
MVLSFYFCLFSIYHYRASIFNFFLSKNGERRKNLRSKLNLVWAEGVFLFRGFFFIDEVVVVFANMDPNPTT